MDELGFGKQVNKFKKKKFKNGLCSKAKFGI